jgi:hypothetical protein
MKRFIYLVTVALAAAFAHAADEHRHLESRIRHADRRPEILYTLKQDGEKVTGKANSDIGGESELS